MQGDGPVGPWRDFPQGGDQTRRAAEELAYLGLCRVSEGGADGGDEGGGKGLRAGRGGEDGAGGGDGAIGKGVAGAAASAVFLGCACALLAAVAEPGQEGAPYHEQGEDREAACSKGGVERCPD